MTTGALRTVEKTQLRRDADGCEAVPAAPIQDAIDGGRDDFELRAVGGSRCSVDGILTERRTISGPMQMGEARHQARPDAELATQRHDLIAGRGDGAAM